MIFYLSARLKSPIVTTVELLFIDWSAKSNLFPFLFGIVVRRVSIRDLRFWKFSGYFNAYLTY